MSQVIAVIVTYNRLALLKQCLQAVEAQSRAPTRVIIVNNASTDGTKEFLDGWVTSSARSREVHHLPTNTGGSGGFTLGIREAYRQGAEWIWVMDDDSIAAPDCLEKLLSAPQSPSTGFLAPIVRWKDGSLCLPNATQADPMNWATSFNKRDPRVRILSATFVGLLLHRRAVDRVGLPVPQFFIWYDDIEFTLRITRELEGFCVTEAEVIHMIPENAVPDFSRVTEANAWKHQYGIRNESAVTCHTKSLGPLRAVALWRQRDREMRRGGVSGSLRLRILAWGLKGLFFPYTQWIERP